MKSPIFVHSLWRSGSTYIFDVFRRADSYWCYQEPIHEFVLMNASHPETLLEIADEAAKALHHPPLDKPYFYELYTIHFAWKDVITKKIIYDEYFASECSNELINYLNVLIDNARGTPVIQECRTSSRIGAIKDAVGGRHIYLWRNPWDQWWSFKINDYFDKALLMVLNAENPPVIIQKLLKEIDVLPFHHENINKEFEYYDKARLSAKDSYSAFYTIWLLGLLEGIEHAHVCVNIDSLSTSDEYKNEIMNILNNIDIDSLDFSDCHVYQSYFTDSDALFFTELEDKIHNLFIASDFSYDSLQIVFNLRKIHKPRVNTEKAVGDLDRVRKIVFRSETECSDRLKPIRSEMYSKHLLFDNTVLSCSSKLGFHTKEAWGMWSSGKNAILRIELKDALLSPVHICIKFGMKIFGPLAEKSPVVKITFGKDQAEYVLFRENMHYVETVELNFLYDGAAAEILFESTHEDSPVNHGSTDSRTLSFGIDHFSANIIEMHEVPLISDETLFLGIQ